MIASSPRLPRMIVLLFASSVALAGCASTIPDPVDTTTATAEPAPAGASPTATTEPTPDAERTTCESLIPQSLVDEFGTNGWTAQEEAFRVGEITLDEGLTCVWGDYSVATDNVQIFGWAPITASDASTVRAELIASGWQRIDDSSGEFLTESPDTVISPDEDGYGLTYQLGDGWILFADRKQSLLLIERPDA